MIACPSCGAPMSRPAPPECTEADRHDSTDAPRVVNTPEKADMYARALLRRSTALERMFTGTQHTEPLAAYFDDLPDDGMEEIIQRLQALRDRIETFLNRDHVCPACGHVEPDPHKQKAHMEAEHPDVIEQRMTNAGFVKREDGTWVDTEADPDG